MQRDDYMIVLDLHEFFADDRQRSRILIHKNYKKIIDLEKRISEIFDIKEFHLLSDGHLLPSCEDIALIKCGETVCVRPNTISSQSLLLSEGYYTDHTNTYSEKNIISKNEIAFKPIQGDSNNFEEYLEAVEVPEQKKKKVKQNISNDHIDNGCKLYASTPNSSNISPAQSNAKRKSKLKEEIIELNETESCERKKRKRKSEKNDSLDNENYEQRKSKKKKHKVLTEENGCDVATNKKGSEFTCEGSQEISLVQNNLSYTEIMQNNKESNEENLKCSRKKHKKKLKNITSTDHKSSKSSSMKILSQTPNSNKLEEEIACERSQEISLLQNNLSYTEIIQNDKESNEENLKCSRKKHKKLKNITSTDHKSSKSSSTKVLSETPNSNKLEEKIESHISRKRDLDPKPLPYKKARSCKSWSTAPLPKRTNLIKIIKVPIARNELDSSRNKTDDAPTPDTILEKSNRNSSDILSSSCKTTKVDVIKPRSNIDSSQLNIQEKDLNNSSIKLIQLEKPSDVSEDNLLQVMKSEKSSESFQDNQETTKIVSVDSFPTSRNNIIQNCLEMNSNNESNPQFMTTDVEKQLLSNSPDRPPSTLKFTRDKQLNYITGELEELEDFSSSKSITTRMPPQNLQQLENDIELQSTATNEVHSHSLPLDETKISTSWSTAPLSKTTNLVKIVKVPIAIIEIDYSRFFYNPDKVPPSDANIANSYRDSSNTKSSTLEAITVSVMKSHNPDASHQKIKQMELHHSSEITEQQPDPIISQNFFDQHNKNMKNFKKSLEISEDNSQQSKSQDSSDKIQHNPELPKIVSVEKSATSEDRSSNETTENHIEITNEKLKLDSCSSDETGKKFGYSNFELGKEERNTKTSSKSEARALWRQKINQKYVKNSVMSETESCKKIGSSNLHTFSRNFSVKEIENPCDKIEQIGSILDYSENKNMKEEEAETSIGSQVEMRESNNRTLQELLSAASKNSEPVPLNINFNISNDLGASNTSSLEDTTFSNTTETDGNLPEPKRKRKRRRQKKTKKNEIQFQHHTKEPVNRYSSTDFWVSAKPKIHLRFNDSDDDLADQKMNSNEIDARSQMTGVEEKIKILQNVSLNPERNSQDEILSENYVENEENIEARFEEVLCNNKLETELPNENNEELEKLKAKLLKTVDALELSTKM